MSTAAFVGAAATAAADTATQITADLSSVGGSLGDFAVVGFAASRMGDLWDDDSDPAATLFARWKAELGREWSLAPSGEITADADEGPILLIVGRFLDGSESDPIVTSPFPIGCAAFVYVCTAATNVELDEASDSATGSTGTMDHAALTMSGLVDSGLVMRVGVTQAEPEVPSTLTGYTSRASVDAARLSLRVFELAAAPGAVATVSSSALGAPGESWLTYGAAIAGLSNRVDVLTVDVGARYVGVPNGRAVYPSAPDDVTFLAPVAVPPEPDDSPVPTPPHVAPDGGGQFR